MIEPTDIWVDVRVANNLPVHKDEELAERGVDQIHYIHEEKVKALLLQAGPPDEVIIQITGSPGVVYGLSNMGNTYALGADGWGKVADGEVGP